MSDPAEKRPYTPWSDVWGLTVGDEQSTHRQSEFCAVPDTAYYAVYASMGDIDRSGQRSHVSATLHPDALSLLVDASPMGRVLILLVYWSVIIYMMVHNAIFGDALFWERIGYRNAWVTVTQVPFLYLLASKTSIIALLAGTSYDRLNWLHRWVARTMFVTATVHGFHFWREWVIADYLEEEFKMMPITVSYGLGGWSILLWMVVTSFKPFRSMAYELFVIQHILAAVFFLWIVYVHVPAYAEYNIWFAVAALCFDRAFRLGMLIWQNVRFHPNHSRCEGGQKLGHQAQLTAVGGSITVLTIKDVHFQWKAGQHLYLWLPRIGLFETHPYTIATPHRVPETCICNSIQLVIRSHSGFSRRLNALARATEGHEQKGTLTAFVAGPYGKPPRWDAFETLVFISASTGASYTLPILESVLRSSGGKCTKRIDFLLAARQGEEVRFYHERLREAFEEATAAGIEINVHISVTGNGQLDAFKTTMLSSSSSQSSSAGIDEKIDCCCGGRQQTAPIKTEEDEISPAVATDADNPPSGHRPPHTSEGSDIQHSATRLDVAVFIAKAVEATGGETGIIACGGQPLVANVRNSVAKLSDERAVHKGSGAQGIYLHVEEYCF